MIDIRLLRATDIPGNLISDLDRRQVALWVRDLPDATSPLPALLGLPWRMVFLEASTPALIDTLEQGATPSDPLVAKRGFIQIIDRDPSHIELPPRCLPVYLLNGREPSSKDDFQSRYRRMSMLDVLRRSEVRHLLIFSTRDAPVPPDLTELWQSGFRSSLLFVADTPDAASLLSDWADATAELRGAVFLQQTVPAAISQLLERYNTQYPEERVVIRLRDRSGNVRPLDITELDDPERPVLDVYRVIQERDLTSLTPEQLSEDELISFFQNPETSWRPYAAGLPWQRDDRTTQHLRNAIKRIDAGGPDENCIAYIVSESGAGGTTLIHALAWHFAHQGYPAMVAKQLPFVPDALAVANYLNRVKHQFEGVMQRGSTSSTQLTNATRRATDAGDDTPHYEVPWIIVFDRVHWEYRDTELRRFHNEMQRQGRPVCILVVSGPMRELAYYDTSVFKELGELNHALDQNDARALGQHLNRYLRVYSKERSQWQWDDFYSRHTVQHLEGWSSFWITLSFWIQRQYDLTESIQEWLYRSFTENVTNDTVRDAVLEIAAMSSTRFSLPEGLLPRAAGEWPTSHVLEDNRANLGPLGLVRGSADGERYWALVHDILGRFLVAGLFYDFPLRERLGFAAAKDPDHLRLLLLRRIAERPELGDKMYRECGDEFAKAIFKIDPDHGRAEFAPFWREVLNALDAMPPTLRDGSRVFRHHSAVSRRRIAALNPSAYGITVEDKAQLLRRAVTDIEYALHSIGYAPGSETDLNLYNSLVHAYHDLADVEENGGAPATVVTDLREKASNAARRAYEENPTNSFVVESYVRDLLAVAKSTPDVVVDCTVEALGILYSAMSSNEESYRRAQLGTLADRAVAILLQSTPKGAASGEPANAVEVLTRAWVVLAAGIQSEPGWEFSDIPEASRIQAIEVLGHRNGRGNMQVIRLSYDLIASTHPYEFKRQLALLDQLVETDYRVSPQLRLERGVLLYQSDRPKEGDRVFRGLRKLWRESEHYVQVPKRMRWLVDASDVSRKRTVRGTAVSELGARAMASVQEFQRIRVPFRPEEFGQREVRPGFGFRCFVSFGHNGPFLRPVTTT